MVLSYDLNIGEGQSIDISRNVNSKELLPGFKNIVDMNGVAIRKPNEVAIYVPPTPFDWQINVMQSVIAFGEYLAITNNAKKSISGAIIILISSLVPSTWGTWQSYNEQLWETILAAAVGGPIMSMLFKGNLTANIFQILLIETSSKMITNEVYQSIILDNNVNIKDVYRQKHQNWAFLG